MGDVSYKNSNTGDVYVSEGGPSPRLERLPNWERLGSDGTPESEPSWPRTHDELDAIAAEQGIEWPEGTAKIDDKVAHLESEGLEPVAAEDED